MLESQRRDLTERMKAAGRDLGLDAVGVAPAVTPPHYPQLLDWLARGGAAGMEYMHRYAALREHPEHLLPGVRSVIMGIVVYGDRADEAPPGPLQGKVARYARGEDYHPALWSRLEGLLSWLQQEVPGLSGRAVADSAPLMERDFAMLAGLGWIGKNTMLLSRRLGSYTLLGALLVDAELSYDEPTSAHCGTCTRCLDACPTQAFRGPYDLDASRCISYWTIEHRGPLPDEAVGNLNGWVFGCDICQEVCPWNRKAPPAQLDALRPREGAAHPDLVEWLSADAEVLTRRIGGTPLHRARRVGLQRNAAELLGESQAREAIPALRQACADADPVVRAAAAGALRRYALDHQVDPDHHGGGGDQDQQDHRAEARGVGQDGTPLLVPGGRVHQADGDRERQDVPVDIDARHAETSTGLPCDSASAAADSSSSAR